MSNQKSLKKFITLPIIFMAIVMAVVFGLTFTNRTEKVWSEEQEGGFEELQKNMTYTLAVKQGSVTIASKAFCFVSSLP